MNKLTLSALILFMTLGLAACSDDEPEDAEPPAARAAEFGEEAEQTMEEAAEETGEAMDEAAEETDEAMDDAGEDTEEAADETGEAMEETEEENTSN